MPVMAVELVSAKCRLASGFPFYCPVPVVKCHQLASYSSTNTQPVVLNEPRLC